MQFFIKNIIRIAPITLIILVILIIQLLFIGTNIVGVILFSQLYSYRKTFKILIAVIVTSLIYDSIKMIPIGSWALSFSVVAACSLTILSILRMQGDKELESWPTTLFLVFVVAVSASAQSYILSRIGEHKLFDINLVYSIVALSTLCIIIQKLNHKKERRLVLD